MIQVGNDIKDKRCARCHAPLTLPAAYRDGMWFHQKCLDDGARQLSNAMRLATAGNAPESAE